jgi:hypothetical protein
MWSDGGWFEGDLAAEGFDDVFIETQRWQRAISPRVATN